MATLKVHHQGWLALPERFCRQLGIDSGGTVEAELVDGTVVLRPAKRLAKAATGATATAAAAAVPAPSALAAQVQDTEQPAAAPPAPKRRGRPPKARPAGG
jgi:antitoxin component of MazEF toxin-antitoxin module